MNGPGLLGIRAQQNVIGPGIERHKGCVFERAIATDGFYGHIIGKHQAVVVEILPQNAVDDRRRKTGGQWGRVDAAQPDVSDQYCRSFIETAAKRTEISTPERFCVGWIDRQILMRVFAGRAVTWKVFGNRDNALFSKSIKTN